MGYGERIVPVRFESCVTNGAVRFWGSAGGCAEFYNRFRHPSSTFLEGHPKFGPRFKPLFEAHGTGRLRFRRNDHHHRRGADRAPAGG